MSRPTPALALKGSYPYHSVREDISEVYNKIMQEVRTHIVTNMSSKIDARIVQRNLIEISSVAGSTINIKDITQRLNADVAVRVLSQAFQSVSEQEQTKMINEIRKKIREVTPGIFSRSSKSSTLSRLYNEMRQVVETVIETNITNSLVATASQANEIIIRDIVNSTINFQGVNQTAFGKIAADIASLAKTDVTVQQEIDAITKDIFDYEAKEGGIFGLLRNIADLVKKIFSIIGSMIMSIGKILTIIPDTLNAIGDITREITSGGRFIFALVTVTLVFYTIIKLLP